MCSVYTNSPSFVYSGCRNHNLTGVVVPVPGLVRGFFRPGNARYGSPRMVWKEAIGYL